MDKAIRMTADLYLKELEQFTGTTEYYDFFKLKLTEGVRYVVKNGYTWFVSDAAIKILFDPKLKNQDFLVIRLKLLKGEKAEMIIDDGNDNLLYRQYYDLTDAKRDIKLYYADGVLMLPNEY